MSTTDPGPPREPTVVTVVQAPGCHFCADAEEALSHLANTYPLRVEYVDIRSPKGQQLVAVHRPAMNPLVLVDGAYFSAGRLPRKKLARLLQQRHALGVG